MYKWRIAADNTGMETREEGLRSGADARAHGRVEEYAQVMKAYLLSIGQTEAQAEDARLTIVRRFGS